MSSLLKSQNFMFQESMKFRCFSRFLFPQTSLCQRGNLLLRKFSTNRPSLTEKNIFFTEQDHLKNESFWFHRLKIPSNVLVSSSVSPGNSFLNGSQIQSPLLKFDGPLGSVEIHLEKIDKYGFVFLKLHKSIHEGEEEIFIDFFVKKLSKKKTLRFVSQNQDSCVFDSKIHQSKDTLRMLGSLVSLCRNAVQGVSFGFVVYLELLGVGYKANILIKEKDQFLEVKVGQSHDIMYQLPKSIKAFLIKPTLIGLYSIDKTELKQIAAEIRSIKSPEPYKGKGIRFKDEVLITKIGKKK